MVGWFRTHIDQRVCVMVIFLSPFHPETLFTLRVSVLYNIGLLN